MAYLKIFPIKVTDKKALDYITNPDKTDEKLLVSSFGCSPETADLEFSMTREMAKKNGMDKGDNLAFHLIQSFKPGEVDAETAHRLGQQFADEVLKGKYEYVISTHVDKNHIHNHIIFNAASFVDHHKYISNKRSYHKICRISNRICHENGLATSMPTGEKGKSYKENMEYHRGTSWKAKLRVAVDKAIWTSINYEEFLQKMQLAGYEIRQGKHLSFRAPEQKNFTYMKSLGSYYSEENVRIRLAKNRNKVKTPKHLSREARLYINISTYVTTGNREGFERWAKLNNLKEAARTFNYLSENNLLNYEDFKQHVSDIEVSVKVADQKIAQINSELSTQKVIQKHCDSYRLCRKVIEDCKSAKNPKAYRTKHQAEYQLHDSLKKELQDLGVTKIPSSNKILKRIENLESEQATTVRKKQELQKKQKTLDIIGRRHTVEDIRKAFADARELGFDNINMDLIMGLPEEDLADVRNTMEILKELDPDNITIHSLAIKRAARLNIFKDRYESMMMVNTQEHMDLCAEYCHQMGLSPYYLYRQKGMAGNMENVGYAKPGKAGVYNVLIMEERQTIVACGAGASTKRVWPQPNADGTHRIERCENVKDVGLYMKRIDEMIARKQQLFSEK